MHHNLIDAYCNINVHENWYASVFEDFVVGMRKVGIDVGGTNLTHRNSNSEGHRFDIYFSGFSSQGDWACFEGKVCDIGLFMDTHFKPEDTAHKWLNFVREYGDATISWYHSGRHSHQNSLDYTIEVDDFYTMQGSFALSDDINDDVHYELIGEVARVVSESFNHVAFEADVQEIVRGYCKQLYIDLESEYNHLTSDD